MGRDNDIHVIKEGEKLLMGKVPIKKKPKRHGCTWSLLEAVSPPPFPFKGCSLFSGVIISTKAFWGIVILYMLL